MSLDPNDASNVYMFMSQNRKVVKILHYERSFMCFTRNALSWGDSRNRCLMKKSKLKVDKVVVHEIEDIRGLPKFGVMDI